MGKSTMTGKRNLPVFFLCFCLGMYGAHRFYVGKIGTGILQLLTFGGFCFWWFVDLIIIISGGFTDKEGNKIALWADEPEGRPFKYSYFTSLAVALTIGLYMVGGVGKISTHPLAPLDPVKVVFIFLSTVPSLLTCCFFSTCYCFMVRKHDAFKEWPAVLFSMLFGLISGLIFNAMTAITVIMHFFDW